MEAFLLFIRIFLFAVFALAGIGKLLDLDGSEKAVKDFGTPENLAKLFAILLPIAELIFAFCFLFVGFSWLGAIGALILLLSFIGGMLYQMSQGNAPDCHCFGAIHSEPVSKKSLIRNIIFAILAVFLIGAGKNNQGLNIWNLENEMALQFFIGLATIALLGAVVYYLKRISEQQNQIMRRIEILELTAVEGGKEIKHEHATDPNSGLPIGAPAPDFSAPDLNGKETTFEHLLMKNKPMLFFFVSPNCAPCAALLPEIETWQNELKGKVDFVFVSSGDAKENADKFGGNTFKQVLLQKDREISEMFGAQWTPTALLVNSDGMIASALAPGDAGIRALVEKIKAESEINFVANGNGGKIGEDFPEFVLKDATGKDFDSKEIKGKRTLVIFWSLGCGYCTQMLEDLREWDKTKSANEPNLLLLSSGEEKANAELGFNSTIVLDNDSKVAGNLTMEGTPSGVLVDESGKIVSQVAVGATQIWALLGKKKS